jgi:ribosomal protein S18 acetylase RimI-like enzyme
MDNRMCTDERTKKSSEKPAGNRHRGEGPNRARVSRAVDGASTVRVETVDNWHKHWPCVLSAIDAAGQKKSLRVDANGWLSARQVLLVAFAPTSNQIAGHLCFRLSPGADEDGDVVVEAHLDALGVHPGFEKVSVQIESKLLDAAKRRARALKCRRLVGFNA